MDVAPHVPEVAEFLVLYQEILLVYQEHSKVQAGFPPLEVLLKAPDMVFFVVGLTNKTVSGPFYFFS